MIRGVTAVGDDADTCDVTVAILTYNHRGFVRTAVDSVLAQDLLGGWEVVIADDCSPDGTAEIVDELCAAHPRVRRLAAMENVGPQRNFRRLLASARGRYVALLEGDDYWTDPEKLRLQVDYLDGNPSMSAVGHLTSVREGDHLTDRVYARGLDGRERLALRDLFRGFPHLSSVMYRRDLLPETPPWFDELKGADLPMLVLLATHGDVGVIRRIMSCYRKNPDSMWSHRPQMERRLDGLTDLEVVAGHLPARKAEMDSAIAELASRIAAMAAREHKPRQALRYGGRALRANPAVAMRRIVTGLRD